jgi:hypothetical protein
MPRSAVSLLLRAALATGLAAAAVLSPAAPAQAALAQVTVTSVSGVPDAYGRAYGQVAMTGTVTCAQSTGAVSITLLVSQTLPRSSESGSATATCAAGPVSWSAVVGAGSPSPTAPPPLHPGTVTIWALAYVEGVLQATSLAGYPV